MQRSASCLEHEAVSEAVLLRGTVENEHHELNLGLACIWMRVAPLTEMWQVGEGRDRLEAAQRGRRPQTGRVHPTPVPG